MFVIQNIPLLLKTGKPFLAAVNTVLHQKQIRSNKIRNAEANVNQFGGKQIHNELGKH